MLVGRNQAKKLACSVVTESLNAVNSVLKRLGRVAVKRLRHGLKRAYLTVSVPCPVVPTRVSGVATTSVYGNGKRSENVGEVEPAEGRHTNAHQGAMETLRTHGSGNGHHARPYLLNLRALNA